MLNLFYISVLYFMIEMKSVSLRSLAGRADPPQLREILTKDANLETVPTLYIARYKYKSLEQAFLVFESLPEE